LEHDYPELVAAGQRRLDVHGRRDDERRRDPGPESGNARGQDVDPHLQFPLLDARMARVDEGAGLDVLGHQVAADPGKGLPGQEPRQSDLLRADPGVRGAERRRRGLETQVPDDDHGPGEVDDGVREVVGTAQAREDVGGPAGVAPRVGALGLVAAGQAAAPQVPRVKAVFEVYDSLAEEVVAADVTHVVHDADSEAMVNGKLALDRGPRGIRKERWTRRGSGRRNGRIALQVRVTD